MVTLAIILGTYFFIALRFFIRTRKARCSNEKASMIRTKDGIQEECYVQLGNVSQYIQIRGENKKNPVMIFLHGGPGGPMAYMSIYYQKELEKQFIMVHWDQRGCGRSYFRGASNEVPTGKQLLQDLDQLVDYLREKFSCEKVMIMGFSCGSLIGCQYIKEHPEKVSGYIGISQCINVWKTNLKVAKDVIEKANGNLKLVEKLKQSYENIEHAKTWSEVKLKDYLATKIYIQKLAHFEGEFNGTKVARLALESPYFKRLDWKWYKISMSVDKFSSIENKLLEEYLFTLDLNEMDKKYEVPMLFINGACDTATPASVVEEYMKDMDAPVKELYVVEQAGHHLYMEKTKEFSEKVIQWSRENVLN